LTRSTMARAAREHARATFRWDRHVALIARSLNG
jgi:hypothetical protein